MISIFLNRIIRAIKIDIDLHEEVEADKSATVQAGLVVVLSSLAAGVGSIHLGATNFLIAPALSLSGCFLLRTANLSPVAKIIGTFLVVFFSL